MATQESPSHLGYFMRGRNTTYQLLQSGCNYFDVGVHIQLSALADAGGAWVGSADELSAMTGENVQTVARAIETLERCGALRCFPAEDGKTAFLVHLHPVQRGSGLLLVDAHSAVGGDWRDPVMYSARTGLVVTKKDRKPQSGWTRVAPLFDSIYKTLREAEDQVLAINFDILPGPTRGKKQARLHNEMNLRGARISTRTCGDRLVVDLRDVRS
jgi:hypothetical protein